MLKYQSNSTGQSTPYTDEASIDDIVVRILVVDDNPANLLSLEGIIEGPNREIMLAPSGNEALKLALKHEFSLILTDVQMPDMDGFEMVDILKRNQKLREIPVIFVTAISKEEKFIHRGYDGGAVDYLFKPLDPVVVSAKVDVFITLARQRVALHANNKELRQLNKTKNKFLGMLAHDLRNPLSVVQHYARYIIDASDNLTSEQKNNAMVIEVTSKFMLDLVNELLDFSKIESGTFDLHKENAVVEQLIAHSVKINSIFASQKSIKLIYEVAKNLNKVALDISKMNQVLNNLISNAIKFSEPETNVYITSWTENNLLKISVRDEGQGIPSFELDTLFEPFTTTSVTGTSGEKSTGLGLTIVSKIVEAHGGEVKVQSEVGVGSEFTISLPTTQITTAVPEQQEPIAASSVGKMERYRGKTARILVCEDDVLLQGLLKRVLNAFEIPASFVENGEDGLLLLQTNPNIELVLTDINMPVMDGFELNNRILDLNLPVKVVALTAHVDEEVTERCKEAGMFSCIEKPLSKLKLEELLEG